jgi:DNA mismatch repair protein MutL
MGDALSLREKICEHWSSFACHHSIRSGRVLHKQEMNALLEKLPKTSRSGQCNHGRPTYIELKKKDIEKLFERA